MRAEQVIDMQADLLSRLDNSERFVKVVREHMRAGDLSEGFQVSEALTRSLPQQVRAAYAYRVSDDMSAMVQHAAMCLEDDDLVDPSLAPTGAGIVRFDRPLPVVDVRGRVGKIHWLTWGPAQIETTGAFGQPVKQTGVILSSWNDLDDPDDIATEIIEEIGESKVRKTVGRWSFIGASVMMRGGSLGPSDIEPTDEERALIESDGDSPSDFTNVDRYLHALWLMLGQTVARTENEHVRSTSRKRAERMGIPARVTVVELRRYEGAPRGEGESFINWSHRWFVRGHWRWQPYGPGRSERKRIWIPPYVKGPEGKPLVVTDKVYDLRR